jgi:predicted RNA-binding protein YlqC (UPF0109 family)
MSTTIDQQFIEYIVKSLVGNPDAVVIQRTIDEKGVLLELTVDPQDLGRVIGKRGAGAQALRTLLRALGTKNDARYNLKIVDNGEPHERRERPEQREEQPHEESAESASEETEQIAEVPEEKPEAPAEEVEQTEEPAGDSVADRTRKELADLDDLDI